MIKIPKAFFILIYANHNNGVCIHDISKVLDITYSHTHKLIKHLNCLGLIETQKLGRKLHIHVTEKGSKISNFIKIILTNFKINYLLSENFEKTTEKPKDL